MKDKDINFDEIFRHAKENTVYAHALVWIRNVMADKEISEKEKFEEINKVFIEAIKHLE